MRSFCDSLLSAIANEARRNATLAEELISAHRGVLEEDNVANGDAPELASIEAQLRNI